jgi:predicted DNA-binding ArsR family transcriptional regulator
MAKTDFRYSDLDFFRSVAPDYGKYLSRLHLKDFTQVLSSKWQMGSVGTKPSVVYFNGIEGTKVDSSAGNVNSSRKWFYDEDADLLTIYVSSTGNNPNDDEVIEIGEDTKTFIEQQLTNASMLLNSLITSVVTPIQKSFIFNDGSATETPEYDYVLKQAECFLAFSNMANAEGDFELADRLLHLERQLTTEVELLVTPQIQAH